MQNDYISSGPVMLNQLQITFLGFRCHPWEIKSSSFVGSWAIYETLKHNITKASDMILDTSDISQGGAGSHG